MPPLYLPRGTLDLHTRARTQIQNQYDRSAPSAGEHLHSANLKSKYPGATHRPTGPSSIYNCHGLTFAARRTGITQPAEVQKILTEDEYEEVQQAAARPGDIVLYYNRTNGDIEHSGIVVEKPQLGLRVLSKWGGAHEVIHQLLECPYELLSTKFFRINK